MIVERRLTAHIDWPLISAVIALSLVGLATIYSVTYDHRPGHEQAGPQFWAQVYALPVAIIAMLVCMLVDYGTLTRRSIFLYALLVLGLLAVLSFGVVRGGAKRWVSIGGATLQPSEFARLVLAIVLASFYGAVSRSPKRLPALAAGGAILGLPAFLIYKQPDLGTAVTLIPVFLGIVYLAGIRMRWLVIATTIAVLLSPVVWMYGLRDYQKERIETFLDPSKDPRGDGYQQIQAKITVGSGGLTGKGFTHGTQGGYGFLPVAHNDFVYSVLAEEQGFLGVLATLGLYLFVIVRGLHAAELAKDRVGAFLVVGIISGFTFQVLYNITMSAGLAPVKGLTLPLMSYGGSSLVATMAGFGLILNVRMRRFTN
jgi:rod shape determining protein RodA